MTSAHPKPGKRLLTPMDHTLVLIDHQSQMAFATKSIDAIVLRNNAALVSLGMLKGPAKTPPEIGSMRSASTFVSSKNAERVFW